MLLQQQVLPPMAPRSRFAIATALGLAACCAIAPCHAEESIAPAVPFYKLSGFATAALSWSDSGDADYTSSVLKGSGAGATARLSANVDSRLGLQLDLNLAAQWSAVLQVISEQRLDKNYRPTVEWANVKYQATPELALRAGRIALPMFLAADYRKIGYAYPWVRTPVEVYGAIAVTSSDGVDATYRWRAGEVKNLTQVFYGRNNVDLPTAGRIEARKVAGFAHTAEMGPASARLSVLSTELTVDIIPTFFAGLRQFGAPGMALANRYESKQKHASAVSLGLNYDPGAWFVMAESGRMRTNSFLGDSTSLYAGGGLRHGALTPFATYARVRADSPTTSPGLPLANLPPAAAAAGAALNGYLGWLLTTAPEQHTVSAGLRWDFAPSMALTGQFDRVSPDGVSRGTFINVQPGFKSGRSINITSVALNVVF